MLCSAWCKLILRAANFANEMQRHLPWFDEQSVQADGSDSESSGSNDGALGQTQPSLLTQNQSWTKISALA